MNAKIKVSKKVFSLPEETLGKWKFEQRPGGWVIAKSSSGEKCRFMIQTHQHTVHVSLRGYLWSGEYLNEARSKREGQPNQKSDLVVQFPGKVRKILVSKGQQVIEGDPLVLVEAMKMEFTIRAPYSGSVREVLVQEGQQLSPGDIYVDLEMIESES